MRLYFDCCCYNRPFDDLSQDRIHDESEAVLSLMNRCRSGQYTVLGSTVLQLEISKIRDFDKKSKVLSLTNIISETIVYSAAIQKRAMELQQIETIRKMDSLHLASAELGLADFFLSTDDKLLKACRRIQDRLHAQVKNPLTFLAEVNENDGCKS